MSEQQLETATITSGSGGAGEAPEPLDYAGELERLESEYAESQPEEQPAEQPEPEAQPEEKPSIYDMIERHAETRREMQATQAENQHWRERQFHAEREQSITDAVNAVKKGGALDLADDDLRRLLIGKVQDDPRGLAAYMNRGEDPKTWGNYLSRMAGDIHASFGKRVLTETSDLEAVEASVRGQHTMEQYRKRIDTSNVGNMTHAQYAEWKRENA